MKTSKKFQDLVKKVGFIPAIAIAEKELPDKFFYELDFDDAIKLAGHAVGNKRLQKLIIIRITKFARPAYQWLALDEETAIPQFLRPVILEQVFNEDKPFEVWRDLYDKSNITDVKEMILTKMKESAASFNDYKIIYYIVVRRSKDEAEAILTSMSKLAASLSEWVYIIGQVGEGSPLVTDGIAALDKIEAPFEECREIYLNSHPNTLWASALEKKMTNSAKRFEDFQFLLSSAFMQQDQAKKINKGKINGILKSLRRAAETFTDWYYLFKASKIIKDNKLKDSSLSQMRLLAQTAVEYAYFYICCPEGSEDQGYGLGKLRQSAGNPQSLWVIARDKELHCPAVQAVITEEIDKLIMEPEEWYNYVYNDKTIYPTVKAMAWEKLRSVERSDDKVINFWKLLSYQGTTAEVRGLGLEKINNLDLPFQRLTQLRAAANTEPIRDIFWLKIMATAKTFEDWLFIFIESANKNLADHLLSLTKIGTLATELNHFVGICRYVDLDREINYQDFVQQRHSIFQQALGNIKKLRLDFETWCIIYNLFISEHDINKLTNPLAVMALKAMTTMYIQDEFVVKN